MADKSRGNMEVRSKSVRHTRKTAGGGAVSNWPLCSSHCPCPSFQSLRLRMPKPPSGAAYLENDFGLLRPPVIHIDTEGHWDGQAHKGDS